MKLPKYATGTQFNVVDVPPKFNDAEIFSSALTTGGAIAGPAGDIGGAIGMAAGGPAGQMLGSQIGKSVGLVGGGIYGAIKAGQLKKEQNSLREQAEQYNKSVPIWNQQSMLQDPLQNKYFIDNPFQMKDGSQLAPEGLAELEKNELVFRTVNSKPVLVADFVHGKTHEMGGEKFVTQQGDIIIPGNKRSEVKKLLDKNNFITDKERFSAIVSKLPVAPVNKEDVMKGEDPKYKKGSKGVKLPKYQTGGVIGGPPNRISAQVGVSPAISGINPNYTSPEVLALYRDQAEERRKAALRGNNPYFVYQSPTTPETGMITQSGNPMQPVTEGLGLPEFNFAGVGIQADSMPPNFGKPIDGEFDITKISAPALGPGYSAIMKGNTTFPIDGAGVQDGMLWPDPRDQAAPITPRQSGSVTFSGGQPTNPVDQVPVGSYGGGSPIFEPSSAVQDNPVQMSRGLDNLVLPKIEPSELGMPNVGSLPNVSAPSGSLLGGIGAGLAGANATPNPAGDIAGAVPIKGGNMGGALAKGVSGLTDLVAMLPGLQDMFEKPEVRTPGRVNLERLQYQDLSDPARRQAIAGRDSTQQQVRNASGGNAAVAMANISQANSQLAKQSADIENFEARRQAEIERANQQIGTQETMTNFQVAEDTRTINEQNRSRAEDMRRSGARSIAQSLQDVRTRNEQSKRDDALMAENKRANMAKEALSKKQIEETKRFQNQELIARTAFNDQSNQNLQYDKDGNIIQFDWNTKTWKKLTLPSYGK